MEGYLLGKRRIDGLLKGAENEKLQKPTTTDSFMAVQNANNLRDTAAKIREDPMLAIKKQEQAAYEAMMNDPAKRRLLMKAAGGGDQDGEREHKRRKHKHHHRHRDDRDRHEKSRSHRDDVDDRHGRSRQRRRRSYTPSESRSRSPPRRMERSRSRSRSPYQKRHSYAADERRQRPRSRSRSYSPPRRNGHGNGVRKMQSWHSSRPDRRRSPSPGRGRERNEDDADDRAARLAAMQQDANNLDNQREQRLADIAEREKVERERDDAARMRNAKHGGRADFVNSFHKKAGDLTLGQRMGRNGVSQKGGDE